MKKLILLAVVILAGCSYYTDRRLDGNFQATKAAFEVTSKAHNEIVKRIEHLEANKASKK